MQINSVRGLYLVMQDYLHALQRRDKRRHIEMVGKAAHKLRCILYQVIDALSRAPKSIDFMAKRIASGAGTFLNIAQPLQNSEQSKRRRPIQQCAPGDRRQG